MAKQDKYEQTELDMSEEGAARVEYEQGNEQDRARDVLLKRAYENFQVRSATPMGPEPYSITLPVTRLVTGKKSRKSDGPTGNISTWVAKEIGEYCAKLPEGSRVTLSIFPTR
jgi:hypothetical protein